MELLQETISTIEQIMGTFECPLNYKCYHSNFEAMCDAVIFGEGELVECLNKDASKCEFTRPFGDGYFCNCPLRIYVARTFKK